MGRYTPQQIAAILFQDSNRITADKAEPGSLLQAQAELLYLGFKPDAVMAQTSVLEKSQEQAIIAWTLEQLKDPVSNEDYSYTIMANVQSPLGIEYLAMNGIQVEGPELEKFKRLWRIDFLENCTNSVALKPHLIETEPDFSIKPGAIVYTPEDIADILTQMPDRFTASAQPAKKSNSWIEGIRNIFSRAKASAAEPSFAGSKRQALTELGYLGLSARATSLLDTMLKESVQKTLDQKLIKATAHSENGMAVEVSSEQDDNLPLGIKLSEESPVTIDPDFINQVRKNLLIILKEIVALEPNFLVKAESSAPKPHATTEPA